MIGLMGIGIRHLTTLKIWLHIYKSTNKTMKLPISKKLEEILRDPVASKQLRKALTGEGDGKITVNGKTYKLNKDAFY
jgi:hypothetical protein